MNIQIRKMVSDDFQHLHRLLSDPEVMKYIEPPYTEEKTNRFLIDAGLSNPPLIYSVETKNRFIGYAIYHDYDEDSVEIGWVLLPEYWGKGYASEVTRILIKRAQKDGKNVVIECVPQQNISKHIAEKNGFAYFGRVEGLDVYKLGCLQTKE